MLNRELDNMLNYLIYFLLLSFREVIQESIDLFLKLFINIIYHISDIDFEKDIKVR